MPSLVATILVFLAVGVGFLFVNLLVGKLVRPNLPSPEKGEAYECGEPPIGTANVQFDLRFYVVALLFVVFDVEVAFLFPWAIVFGTATRAGSDAPTAAERDAAMAFARFAFAELVVFFGVLLVGFAYLWRRGDLAWVRSTAGQPEPVREGQR
ncbi:MAG: NADH-quinone oxidoreductase subunit A [Fimbriiglobus sp.]